MDVGRKPLGYRAYGHVPHLPGSRLGSGDHHVSEGQARICTVRTRDKWDTISVTEKVDGSNVSVAKIGGEIVPLIRAGYRADQETARYQHKLFAEWVYERQERFYYLLQDGERVCGEWLAQAHGTRYELDGNEPFVAFDLILGQLNRAPYAVFLERCALVGVQTAHCYHVGGAISIPDALALAGEFGRHGALDPIEGLVWRVERRGGCDFLAKYVRADKTDGSYFNGEAVWNWLPWKPSPHRS